MTKLRRDSLEIQHQVWLGGNLFYLSSQSVASANDEAAEYQSSIKQVVGGNDDSTTAHDCLPIIFKICLVYEISEKLWNFPEPQKMSSNCSFLSNQQSKTLHSSSLMTKKPANPYI